jgi:hypothetical protein
MTTERTETVSGATNGAPGDSSYAGDPFAAQDAARTVELPLAGRTMIDLGRQVAEWRAKAEQAEAERDELLNRLECVIGNKEKAEAERDIYRSERDANNDALQDTLILLHSCEADNARLRKELADGWDKATVARQVADFNAVCDAARDAKEERDRLRAALEEARSGIAGGQTCYYPIEAAVERIDAALKGQP